MNKTAERCYSREKTCKAYLLADKKITSLVPVRHSAYHSSTTLLCRVKNTIHFSKLIMQMCPLKSINKYTRPINIIVTFNSASQTHAYTKVVTTAAQTKAFLCASQTGAVKCKIFVLASKTRGNSMR